MVKDLSDSLLDLTEALSGVANLLGAIVPGPSFTSTRDFPDTCVKAEKAVPVKKKPPVALFLSPVRQLQATVRSLILYKDIV